MAHTQYLITFEGSAQYTAEAEAATRGVLYKKVFLEISQN